jgi:hypothetical protein
LGPWRLAHLAAQRGRFKGDVVGPDQARVFVDLVNREPAATFPRQALNDFGVG